MRNYRPVALLSPISKVLERLVFEQMYRHFHGNKIFHTNLHGYRKYRSTQTALITIYDRWVRSASQGKLSGAVLLDLSAAFDLVDHHLLLQKLRIYGLQKDCLDWLTSYLGGRYQAVWIDHQLSDFLNCDVGVPQGSILGPLLFLLYLNDLPEILESQADSYADDTTLTATGDSIQEVEEKLTRDGCKVSLWMKSNRLKLNPQKTHLLTIGTQRKLTTLPRKLLVRMDGVLLDENLSGCESLLGCQVDATMKWNSQVNSLLVKLRKRLNSLWYLQKICPFGVRKTMTEGIFNSVMNYCLPLFGGVGKVLCNQIQVLQNRAARFVCNAPPRANRSRLFANLDWLTVNQTIRYQTLIAIYKIRKTKEPEYLANFICRDSRNQRIMLPLRNLTLFDESFCVRGSNHWNQLPLQLRRDPKLESFKRGLEKWIMEKVPQFQD